MRTTVLAVTLAAVYFGCGSGARSPIVSGAPPESGTSSDDPMPAPPAKAVFPPAGLQNGWRWENPSPAAFTLRGVWAVSAGDVWAVGDNGAIEHFDGKAWTLIASPVTTSLVAVWGSDTNDVWAVGEKGTIVHFDGLSWTQVASPTTARLGTLSGTAADNVWASSSAVPFLPPGIQGGAEPDATLLHFDGKNWKTVASESPTAVAALARNDVWVGSCGSLRHFDGMAWTSFTTPDGCISDLAGVPGGPVFAVNLSGVYCMPHALVLCSSFGLLRFDGTAWTSSAQPAELLSAREGRIWAFTDRKIAPDTPTLATFEGGRWTRRSLQRVGWRTLFQGPHRLAAPPGGEAWVVGEGGRRIRFDGTTFVEPDAFRTYNIRAMFGRNDCDLWAVGDLKLVLHRDCAGDWTFVDVVAQGLSTVSDDFYSVAATGPADVFISDGAGYLHHFDGVRWTRDGRFGLVKLYSVGNGVIYATTALGLLRYDTSGWQTVFPFDFVGTPRIWGSSPSNVWTSDLQHFDGNVWNSSMAGIHLPDDGVQRPTPDLLAGSAPDDVWFGGNGLLWHYDGSSWTPVPNPVLVDALASGGRGKVWAATSNGGNKPVHVFRIDGSAWTDFLAPTTGETLLFSTATTIYAYGPNGQILSHGL